MGARHKSEGFAQMPVNRENPSVGNTPIRAPTVREGLQPPCSKRVCRNPSLTVGALMGVRPDPLLCRTHPCGSHLQRVRCYSRIMPRFEQPGPIAFWPRAVSHARCPLMLATVATACAQTAPVTSLNGTWDFAFASDAPAADRLARFYEDGFQGGGF